MDLEFVKNYGGRRIEREVSFAPFFNEQETEEEEEKASEQATILSFEETVEDWKGINPLLPISWRAHDWKDRPVRFVDGSDRGQTVACLRGLLGYLVPIRLAEIGSVVMRVINGELRREFAHIERVVTMDTSAFPWEEIENFAAALRKHQLRLLPAKQLDLELSNDFQRMTNTARRRSNYEMSVLEEIAIAQDNVTPTIVDGPLKTHEGGFDIINSPVFGVVKTYRKTYLHPQGQQLIYQLETGERTPAFSFEYDTSSSEEGRRGRLPVVAWYLRISGGNGAMPNLGIVRVEVSHKWFEARGFCSDTVNAKGIEFVNQLSRTVFEYRCRESSYRRADISLHPIVRAEQSLRALFCPGNLLKNNFYKLTEL